MYATDAHVWMFDMHVLMFLFFAGKERFEVQRPHRNVGRVVPQDAANAALARQESRMVHPVIAVEAQGGREHQGNLVD